MEKQPWNKYEPASKTVIIVANIWWALYILCNDDIKQIMPLAVVCLTVTVLIAYGLYLDVKERKVVPMMVSTLALSLLLSFGTMKDHTTQKHF